MMRYFVLCCQLIFIFSCNNPAVKENLNIKEANEFFNMLNDLNPDWINADLYESDTSSFENLSKFNEYQ